MADVIVEGGARTRTALGRHRIEEYVERPVGRTFALAAIVMLSAAALVALAEPFAAGRSLDWSTWALALSVAAVAIGVAGCLLVLRRRSLAERRPIVRCAALAVTSIVSVWMPLQLLRGSLMEVGEPVARQVSTIAVAAAVSLLCTALLGGRGRRQRWQAGVVTTAGLAIVIVTAIPVRLDLNPWTDSGVGADRIGIIVTSAALMLLGQRKGQWLPAFAGLSLGGYLLATVIAGDVSPTADVTYANAGAGLIALLASAILMVGVNVELELDDAKAQERLIEAWHQVRIGVQREVRARSRHDEVLHDLRSGLLGIESVSPLLGSNPDDAQIARLMGLEVSRLRALTDNRPNHGEFFLIEALAPTVELRTRQGCAVTVTGAEVVVHGARFDVIEIVQNLLDNCVRHAPGTPITISVSTEQDAAIIRVGDRGPGVAEQFVDQIFESGYTTHSDGTGLGLSSARWLAQSQGGDLWYEARLGGGAMLVLSIPRASSEF